MKKEISDDQWNELTSSQQKVFGKKPTIADLLEHLEDKLHIIKRDPLFMNRWTVVLNLEFKAGLQTGMNSPQLIDAVWEVTKMDIHGV